MRCVWAGLLFISLGSVLGCGDDAGGGTAGKACSSDQDCAELSCIAQPEADPEDLVTLPLACGTSVGGAKPGEACEASSDCALGVCLLSGACARPCDTAASCDAQERCDFAYARTATEALQTLHACVAMVDLPKDAIVHVSTKKRALTGALDEIVLPATSDTTLFVLEHLDDARWPFSNTSCRTPLCAQKLVTRDSPPRVLFDLEHIDQALDGPLNAVANDSHVSPVTVLLPNSMRSEPSARGYTLTLENTAPGDLRITQLQRKQQGQRLDLNVFYVGARDFVPTGARGPMLLANALEEVDRILGQADIFIGDVRQIEVADDLLQHGTPIEDVNVDTGFAYIAEHFGVCPELPELFKLSTGAGNSAINLFFVADIGKCGASGDIGAISGGTPGPLGMHGTPGSGIAISTDMMSDENNPKQLGRTLAHEIGHTLGLFHTSEVNSLVFDPLDDTAVCGIELDRDGDGFLSASECKDAGADNLMFPTTETSSVTLTPDQRAVLRSALILR